MPEILAPAGNFEMLKAAVVNGADAVYLGLSRFSARAKAANFDGEELKKAIDYAHLFGTKVYVAINTVIKDEEMSDALLEAENALRLGADALIVQDLGLAQKLRSLFPDAVLHASTQMGIHKSLHIPYLRSHYLVEGNAFKRHCRHKKERRHRGRVFRARRLVHFLFGQLLFQQPRKRLQRQQGQVYAALPQGVFDFTKR